MNAQGRIETAAAPDERPRSAVTGGVGLVGLLGLVAWAAFARSRGWAGPVSAMGSLLACGVPMVLWSLLVDKVHRNCSTGIDWTTTPRPLRDTADISLAKIVGLWGVWGVIGCLYCIARWYWRGDYLFSMQALALAAVPALVLSVPYVFWLDRRLEEPRDGAWQFGRLLIGRNRDVDRIVLYDFFRSWAVKGFFLAFMISIVPGNWANVIAAPAAAVVASPVNLSLWLIAVMFLVDVSFATVGYILTMKPLDSHIRSANPYAAGWTAALICYPPFVLMDVGRPLFYQQNTADWTYWLESYPLVMALTGIVLVALTGFYAWATVAFGIRFSNLTHRGILTHGPYAWTKHPAYLSKNLFWWLATLPFLVTNGNPIDMVRNTVILAMVSGVYYWRARTEERHLMADPAYRAYAGWMQLHGPLPRMIRALKGEGKARPVAAE